MAALPSAQRRHCWLEVIARARTVLIPPSHRIATRLLRIEPRLSLNFSCRSGAHCIVAHDGMHSCAALHGHAATWVVQTVNSHSGSIDSSARPSFDGTAPASRVAQLARAQALSDVLAGLPAATGGAACVSTLEQLVAALNASVEGADEVVVHICVGCVRAACPALARISTAPAELLEPQRPLLVSQHDNRHRPVARTQPCQCH